jgi:hypothetical protein
MIKRTCSRFFSLPVARGTPQTGQTTVVVSMSVSQREQLNCSEDMGLTLRMGVVTNTGRRSYPPTKTPNLVLH